MYVLIQIQHNKVHPTDRQVFTGHIIEECFLSASALSVRAVTVDVNSGSGGGVNAKLAYPILFSNTFCSIVFRQLIDIVY